MAAFNTGTTAALAAAAHTTAFTFTVPAGVATGDVMIVALEVFTFTSASPAVGTPSSGGGSWTAIGPGLVDSGAASGLNTYATCWYRVATASDPGSTFTVSWTGATPGTDQIWWTACLDSYTGFYTASPIGSVATPAKGTAAVGATPSTTTQRAGSWAVCACLAAIGSSGSITAAPAGMTQRSQANPGSGVDCAVADSAGSVGGAGTAIGGGSFTTGGAASWWTTWTFELATQAAPAPVTAAPVPPQIPHPLWFELLEVAQSRADWQAQGVASLAPFTWRLMDGGPGRPGTGSSGTQPPAAATANSGNMIPGLSWYVTQGGMWFQGYWWYVCPSGGQSTAPQKFALWSDAPASASGGAVVPGTVVTSGTLSTGWNWIPLPQPVQLALYSIYIAATTANSGPFPETAGQFSSGGPYQAGISNGPLACLSDANGSNPAPSGYAGNGCFSTAGSDPSLVMPATDAANAGDLLWLDVQVTNSPPAGWNGSSRLWPNTADADYATEADAPFSYVIGTEVILDRPCVLNALWYYIPPGMGSSGNQWATSADVWNARTGTRVATQPNPVWIRQFTGGVDGQSNAGRWVFTQFPGTVTLPRGDYYFTVYNGNVSPNGWGAKRLGYWQPYVQSPDGTFKRAAPGANGIATGPMNAPTTPAASPAYQYNGSNPGATPPYSDGVIEPGQSVFAQGPPNQPPYLYVDQLFQNYWVDPELTPASAYQPDAPDLPQRLPHPLFAQLLEVAAYRAEGRTPPVAYARPLPASAVVSGALQDQVGKNLTAPAVVTGTLARQVSRVLAASLLAAVTVARGAGRSLAAAAVLAGTCARNPGRTLSAGAAVAASVIRQPGKLLTAPAVAAGSVIRQAARTLGGSAVLNGTLARGVSRAFSGGVTLTGALSAIKVRLLTLAASLPVSAALSRNAGKALAATASASGSVRRQCGKALGTGIPVAASLGRGITRRLAAAAGLAAQFVTGGGGTNHPLTFSARVTVPAVIVTVAGRVAHLWSLGTARLGWAAGRARQLWTTGRARND